MEYYIARQPVFNRGMEVFGYKLTFCTRLRDSFIARYKEPEDADALYRLLCFAEDEEMPDQPTAFIDYFDELFDHLIPLLPREHTIIEYNLGDNSEQTDLKNLIKVKTHGYGVAIDATVEPIRSSAEAADIHKIDFTALSPEKQSERLSKRKGRAAYLAYNIGTWDDFKKAFLIGYDYFQGSFFLQPFPGNVSGMRSFNVNILRVFSELGNPEPSFKEITNIIEHDLNLSYKLLKLVNSAYFAPRFKVKTISQAVTMLGLNELNKFASAMLMKETQSPGNTELLRRSLVRGKLMELMANMRNITQKGSEAFFTGIFSMIDVILNRKMDVVLADLPLTDSVKGALCGDQNAMRELLELVINYENADWDAFESHYAPDMIEQQELMNAYLSALAWAESLDF